MKTRLHFVKGFSRRPVVTGSLAVILFVTLFFAGCYEWRNIFQPETVAVNSFFDVWLSAQDDGNPDNDWTNPDLHDLGLFGVMLPVGWDVQDSIHYWVKTTEAGYDNDGILVYSAARSQTLTDSIPPPAGYYWWGAETDGEASLVFFDSLYFQPRIYTDGQVGTFYLRYAIGDVDYWDRNPADDVSDPIAISAVAVNVEELFGQTNIRIYPNPADDILNIEFSSYENQVVHMSLFDATGKTVSQSKLLSRKNQIRVDQLPAGSYFLKLTNGSSTVVKPCVIR